MKVQEFKRDQKGSFPKSHHQITGITNIGHLSIRVLFRNLDARNVRFQVLVSRERGSLNDCLLLILSLSKVRSYVVLGTKPANLSKPSNPPIPRTSSTKWTRPLSRRRFHRKFISFGAQLPNMEHFFSWLVKRARASQRCSRLCAIGDMKQQGMSKESKCTGG